jgi:sigma-E factor negative regulatory protein RseB
VRRGVPVAGAVLVLGPLALLVLLVAPGRSAPPESADPVAGPGWGARPVVEAQARRLLDRAAAAPALTSYSGVQFVSAWTSSWTTSEVVEVDHEPGRGTTVSSDASPSSPARSMTLTATGTPSIAGGGAVGVLAAHYSLSVVGAGEVAGRPVDVVAARRPGTAADGQESARFWLDRESGLVLRREVYDRRGRITRANAFVQVTVGTGAVASGPGSRAWAGTIDTAALAGMRGRGWDCPDVLPGPLALVDARRRDGAAGGIVHLSYSDGIATVSVFEQRGQLDEGGLPGHRRYLVAGHEVWVSGEVPRRVVWTSGRTVYTVVADAPERTVDQVVAALPHRPAADGDTLGRLGRGLDRVASWFNPFG